jgi:hypothetical protein
LNDDDVLEAARTIRSFLADLPGLDDPGMIDATLAVAVAQGDAPAADAELRRLHATRRWAKEFNRRGVPPELVGEQTRSGASPLPGHGEIVAAPRFRCPENDYVWYRRTSGPVTRCPTHGLRVVPDPVTTS